MNNTNAIMLILAGIILSAVVTYFVMKSVNKKKLEKFSQELSNLRNSNADADQDGDDAEE